MTNLACVLLGSEHKSISPQLQTIPVFDLALSFIYMDKSRNLPTFLFKITDVPEDYREEVQSTIIERGWKVSRTLADFFLEIDFESSSIYVKLAGRGRMSNKIFIIVKG
ncbi:MAG: hypothetical protein C0180_00340 [Aciduliprofundum sp.]|nr:MAG: hypothetical protein C0180_00340 [Aciduliprofundum sp.]